MNHPHYRLTDVMMLDWLNSTAKNLTSQIYAQKGEESIEWLKKLHVRFLEDLQDGIKRLADGSSTCPPDWEQCMDGGCRPSCEFGPKPPSI